MRARESGRQRTIPLCGIVLVLGGIGCNRVQFYSYTAPHEGMQRAAGSTSVQQDLIALTQDFLKDVPKNERATFDRFFADDVIYTRSSGQVVTKKDILVDTGNSTAPRTNSTFTGEDFSVRQHGDTAVVNFRLVMHATENDKPVIRRFRNTGTFMKRNGQWQVVAWQATPIAEQK